MLNEILKWRRCSSHSKSQIESFFRRIAAGQWSIYPSMENLRKNSVEIVGLLLEKMEVVTYDPFTVTLTTKPTRSDCASHVI